MGRALVLHIDVCTEHIARFLPLKLLISCFFIFIWTTRPICNTAPWKLQMKLQLFRMHVGQTSQAVES